MPTLRSKHRLVLSEAEVAEAARVSRQFSAPFARVMRARLTVLLLAEPEVSHAEAARRCGVDRETVYKWRRRWAKHGWSLGDAPRSGRPRVFPPQAQVMAKALACERAGRESEHPTGCGLARFSVLDVRRRLGDQGFGASYSTVWRWLREDLLRPWFHRTWMFPRDPNFFVKASVVLDLYAGLWQGEPLEPGTVVLSADELTAIQVKERIHDPVPPGPGRKGRCEFEYRRHGTRCHIPFLNVHTGRVFGLTFPKSGGENFEVTLGLCLKQPEIAAAPRVFVVVDNGPSHHPSTSPQRVKCLFPKVELVHLPIHASWLNQVEIYLSILTRKALRPADFRTADELDLRIFAFQEYYNRHAQPFQWKFTREKLQDLMKRLAAKGGEYSSALAKSGLDALGNCRVVSPHAELALA